MAPKGTNMVLVLILVLMLWGETKAQSGCTTALVSLAPCLNYVPGNSSTPSSSCCSQLSNVVQAQPQCLCSLLNGGGTNLGPFKVFSHFLRLSLSHVVDIGVANGPTSSIADSPISNSPSDEIPEAPTSSSSNPTSLSGGSKSGPSKDTNHVSVGTIAKAPAHVLRIALFVVLCDQILNKNFLMLA